MDHKSDKGLAAVSILGFLSIGAVCTAYFFWKEKTPHQRFQSWSNELEDNVSNTLVAIGVAGTWPFWVFSKVGKSLTRVDRE